MPKVAALVDGHAEHSFLRRTFPPDEIKIIRCLPNGDDVQLAKVAEAMVDKLETLSGEYDRVMVLFDRENRMQTVAEIATQLLQLIGPAARDRIFIFGVKDTEFENWILADEQFVKSQIQSEYTYNREGLEAKSILAELYEESLSFERVASMLAECSASSIASNSASFAHFHACCGQMNWWWLRQ